MPSDFFDGVAKILDVAINGRRPASQEKTPKITLEELIARETSHVRLAGKIYKIVVTEVK